MSVSGYENFMKRMSAGGDTMRGEQIENAVRLLEQTFTDDPAYVPEGTAIVNSDRKIYPRIYEQKYRSTSPAHANIQTRNNDPFYMGDIIDWTGHGKWLVLNVNNIHGVNYQGTLVYCNYTLKFKSPNTGEILEYPVSTLNATQYGSGETEKYDDSFRMTIGTSQTIIYITYDEHTKYIDNGLRFLIDRNPIRPTAFRATQVDMVAYSDNAEHGYIMITAYEDQLNPDTDNIDEMIADKLDNPIGDATGVDIEEGKWL